MTITVPLWLLLALAVPASITIGYVLFVFAAIAWANSVFRSRK